MAFSMLYMALRLRAVLNSFASQCRDIRTIAGNGGKHIRATVGRPTKRESASHSADIGTDGALYVLVKNHCIRRMTTAPVSSPPSPVRGRRDTPATATKQPGAMQRTLRIRFDAEGTYSSSRCRTTSCGGRCEDGDHFDRRRDRDAGFGRLTAKRP